MTIPRKLEWDDDPPEKPDRAVTVEDVLRGRAESELSAAEKATVDRLRTDRRLTLRIAPPFYGVRVLDYGIAQSLSWD